MNQSEGRLVCRMPIGMLMLVIALFALTLAPWSLLARSSDSALLLFLIVVQPFVMPLLIQVVLVYCVRPSQETGWALIRREWLRAYSLILTFHFYGCSSVVILLCCD
jgi:hypothetical protein